jgi:anti-sigma regulatory factor (Ser/Thr protein kinase)
MEMTEREVFVIDEASQVGEARRAGSELARSVGFGEVDTGRVALAVTEAAANIVKHGGGGHLLLRTDGNGVGFIALDRGPGMSVAQAMRDGFSTAGTPGTGLGAIERQASEFDMYAVPGHGTAIAAHFWTRPPAATRGLQIGGVTVPKRGESVCGDGWDAVQAGSRVLILVADGLGHGPLAAAASQRAIEVLRAHAAEPVVAIVERMHAALRSTRGAAAGVAEVDRGANVVRFVGIGNIAAATVVNGHFRSMVSLHGTLGHDVRKVQEFQYPWSRDGLLVMTSDGIGSRWNLDTYPGLAQRSAALVAAVLYRDFQRGNDDATVVVLREVE